MPLHSPRSGRDQIAPWAADQAQSVGFSDRRRDKERATQRAKFKALRGLVAEQSGPATVSQVRLPHIEPIAPQKLAAPFDHPDVLFELKHDGFRAMLYVDRGRGRLVSRRGNVLTRFQPLADDLVRELRVAQLLLDGEVVILDDRGRSLFNPLLRRDASPIFYAFDLVWSSAGDLRPLPLRERKAMLHGLCPSGSDSMLVADGVIGSGAALFAEVCRLDCEGIVAKPLDSPYALVRGRSPWLKVLNPDYSQKRGRVEMFNRRR